MKKSRIEKLFEALLNGKTSDVKPQSRNEAYLSAILENGGVGGGGGSGTGLPKPDGANKVLMTDSNGEATWSEPLAYSYMGQADVLPEITLQADNPDDPMAMITEPFFITPIIAGNAYTVTYNGSEYAVTAIEVDMMGDGSVMIPTIGNLASVGGSDTGEPFVIMYLPEAAQIIFDGAYGALVPLDGSMSITLKITESGKAIKPMGKEYLGIEWLRYDRSLPSEQDAEVEYIDLNVALGLGTIETCKQYTGTASDTTLLDKYYKKNRIGVELTYTNLKGVQSDMRCVLTGQLSGQHNSRMRTVIRDQSNLFAITLTYDKSDRIYYFEIDTIMYNASVDNSVPDSLVLYRSDTGTLNRVYIGGDNLLKVEKIRD